MERICRDCWQRANKKRWASSPPDQGGDNSEHPNGQRTAKVKEVKNEQLPWPEQLVGSEDDQARLPSMSQKE